MSDSKPPSGTWLTGGCFCGAVTYQVQAPLGAARQCHCSRCRKAFGGAGSAYVEVGRGKFAWLSGADARSSYEAMPGWHLVFCRHCGSTLAGEFRKDVHGITLGSIDGDPGVRIEFHQFVGSKATWHDIGGDAPCYDAAPPALS